jgi:Skp family chaperone for outer membrane proteins
MIEKPSATIIKKESKSERTKTKPQPEQTYDLKKILEAESPEIQKLEKEIEEKDEKKLKKIRQEIGLESKESLTEKEAKELVESLEGGVFLGTEEIKEASAD